MLSKKIFECKAYAKINLFLDVYNKTKDNMHNLESLVCFIDLYDEIKIKKSKNFSIKIQGPFKNNLKNKENIIKKTFVIYSKFLNLKTRYKIHLKKNIPVSAGLGGGSADAAVILKGLNYFNNNKLDKKTLLKLAMEIGSDVPICLNRKNAFFSGYGDILKNAPKIPSFFILLINPNKELSTKKVFNSFKTKKKNKKKNNNFNKLNFFSWISKQKNDLQEYSIKILPEIQDMLYFFSTSKNCFFYSMTGSGPTVFGLFKNKIDAIKASHILNKNYSKWWSAVYSIKT